MGCDVMPINLGGKSKEPGTGARIAQAYAWLHIINLLNPERTMQI